MLCGACTSLIEQQCRSMVGLHASIDLFKAPVAIDRHMQKVAFAGTLTCG